MLRSRSNARCPTIASRLPASRTRKPGHPLYASLPETGEDPCSIRLMQKTVLDQASKPLETQSATE